MNKLYSTFYRHRKASIAIVVIAFVNFLYSATNLIYNNDSIGRLFRDPIETDNIGFLSGRWHHPDIYKMTGRWFYPFVYNLVIDITKVPVITLIFCIASLTLCCILIWEIFEVKNLLPKILVGGLYITSPILIHFFLYEGDAEVYYFALFLITWSLYQYVHNKTWWDILISVVLIVLALACYPALFSYVTAIYLFYIFHQLIKASKLDKSFIFECLKVLIICGAGIVIYFLLTKLILNIYNLEMTSYRNAQDLSIWQVIQQLPVKFKTIYTLFLEKFKTEYFFKQIVFIINIITLFTVLTYNSRRKISKLPIGLILLLLLPLGIMSIYMIVFQDILYKGFEFGFLIFYSIPVMYLFKDNYKYRTALATLFGYAIFIQIQVSNRIALEHKLNVESSKLILSNILHDIQKVPDFDAGKVIWFTGRLTHNTNFHFIDMIPKTEMMNFANEPVAFVFEGDYFITNMRGQIRTMGLNYNITYGNDIKGLKIPEYPKEGSIKYLNNDTIMVNLGNIR